MPGYIDEIGPSGYAPPDAMQTAYQTVSQGAQQYGQTVTGGMQHLISDLGSMIPTAPPVNVHPFTQVRHGMYGHEMSFGGDIKAMFGVGTPATTTTYEYQNMAQEDFSRRVANAVSFGSLYTASSAVAWVGGGGMLVAGASKGFKAGKAAAFARMGGAAAIRAGTLGVGAARAGMTVAGLIGGAVGAAPATAAFLAIDATVGKIVADVEDRQDIMNFVEASSFRYADIEDKDRDTKMGGFNRSSRAKIAAGIKKVDLGDSSYNMEDLKGILERGTEMGMFEGTRSAEDFNKKFKDLTTQLKSVTKILHQSLEEGMQTIKDLKEQGYRGTPAIQGAIAQADVLGSVTGRTAAEMISIGRQGAEMVRGTGINMATGSAMMQQTYAMVQGASTSGALSAETIAQGGGVGTLAQSLMGQSIGMLGSTLGQGFLAGIGNKAGGLNQGLMNKLMGGGLPLEEVFQQGSENLSTAGGYVDAVLNRGANMKQLTSQYGGMGAQFASLGMEISIAKETAPLTGKSVRDMIKFNALQRGESEETIDARLALMDNRADYASKQRAAFQVETSKVSQEELRARTDISGRLGDWVDKKMAPISNAVGDMVDSIAEGTSKLYETATNKITDTILGTTRVKGATVTQSEFIKMVIGGGKELTQTISKADQETRTRLSQSIWSEGEAKDFAQSEKFQALEAKYGDKFSSSEVGKASGDIDTLSQALFDGKRGWSNLTKDERMFMENKVQTMGGMEKVKEQIQEEKSKAYKTRKDVLTRSMGRDEETIKAQSADAKVTRDEAIVLVARGDFFGKSRDTMQKLGEDEEGAEALDKLLGATATVRAIEEKRKSLKEGESLTEDEEAQLKSARTAQADAKNVAIKKGIDRKDISTVQSQVEKAPQDVLDKITQLTNKRSAYDKSTGGVEGRAIQSALTERFEAIAGSAKKGSKEISSYLNKILSGDNITEEDTSKFRKLSESAESSAVSNIAVLATTAFELQNAPSSDQAGTREKLTTLLEQKGFLTDVPKGKQGALIDSFIKDGQVDAKALISTVSKFEILGQTGATRVAGGTDSRTVDAQMSATVGLQEVQAKTAEVLAKLTELAARLGK